MRFFKNNYILIIAFLLVSIFSGLAAIKIYHLHIPENVIPYKDKVMAARSVRETIESLAPAFRRALPDNPQVDALITLTDEDSIRERRDRLYELLWPDLKGLPYHSLPFLIEEKSVGDITEGWLSKAAGVTLLQHKQEYDITTTSIIYTPFKAKNCAVIYHAGHKGDVFSWDELFGNVLSHGCYLITMTMPFKSTLDENNPLKIKRFGNVTINHFNIGMLKTETFTPLKLFIHPVIEVINYLNGNNIKNIEMVGYSGGGWTTILTSALDPRVSRSASVAGFSPLFILTNPEYTHPASPSKLDYEQTDGAVYSIANYVELFIMGASGKGRKQTHYLLYDGGVFPGKHAYLYMDAIERFRHSCRKCDVDLETDLYFDETGHGFSSDATEKIIDNLGDLYR